MRLTIRGSIRRQTRELRVTLQGRELPDYSQMRALRACDSSRLVALTQERENRSGRMTLCYDVSGLKSLRSCLKNGSRRHLDLRTMLNDLVGALEWVAGSIRGSSLVLFDPQYVYVDDGDRLVFVLLPLKGFSGKDDQSPFVLLDAMANARHDKGRSPNEREMAKRLSEFVGGEARAFSLNRLRAFVREECLVERQDSESKPPGRQGTENKLPGRQDSSRKRYDRRVAARKTSAQGRAGEGGRVVGTRFYLLRDQQTGEVFRLAESQRYELGRGQACGIRLRDCPKVSRRHAAVRCLSKSLMLEDLGSTNGTYVAGKRIASHHEIGVAYGKTFMLSNRKFSVRKGEA